jgi:phosphoserine phosphatase
VQADFLFRRWREMAEKDPAKGKQQPYKAVVEGDKAWLAGLADHLPDLIRGVTEAYEGITTKAFEDAVGEFFATATHPTLGVPYTQVGYRPMRELIAMLKNDGFTVYICSAGGRDFVRPVAEQMYGVSRECVIGSATTLEYRDGHLYRAHDVEQPIDDGPGKPVHIWSRTGRVPLLAGGNADGDTAMLETARFGMLIHHDDAEREFAYDAGAERALAEAAKRDWLAHETRLRANLLSRGHALVHRVRRDHVLRFGLRPVDERFFESAPWRYADSFEIDMSPGDVWAELVTDGALSFCRSLGGAKWTSPRPFGVGTTRTMPALVGALIVEETFFRWEDGRRQSLYAVRTSLPMFRRFAEDYVLEETSPTACRLTWTIALDPNLVGRAGKPLNAAMVKGLFKDTRRHFPAPTGRRPSALDKI